MYMEERTTIQVSGDVRKELRSLAAKRDENYQVLLKDMIQVFKELDDDKTIISIPKKLSKKIEDKLPSTDFNTISEYVAFILRLILYEESSVRKKNEKIDEKEIKQKLKSECLKH